MPQTIEKTPDHQLIAGIFCNRVEADEAISAFRELGIASQDIEVVQGGSDKVATEPYSTQLSNRGFSDGHAKFYGKTVDEGKVLVIVRSATEPAPIIDLFDEYGAEYNPNGARNVRQDVVGLTAGAAAGAIAGGAVGAASGGPVGAVVGAAAGAMVGGGAGAAVGSVAEHRK